MMMRSKMRLAMLTLRIMMRSDLDIDCRDSIMDMMQSDSWGSVFSADIRSCRSDSADNLHRETPVISLAGGHMFTLRSSVGQLRSPVLYFSIQHRSLSIFVWSCRRFCFQNPSLANIDSQQIRRIYSPLISSEVLSFIKFPLSSLYIT